MIASHTWGRKQIIGTNVRQVIRSRGCSRIEDEDSGSPRCSEKNVDTTTICGESTYKENTGYYEVQWYHGFSRVTKNGDGTTGWATIIHTTNLAVRPRTICRIHLCKHSPCRAVHPASKHGAVGPPMHLQKVPKRTAVDESSGSPLAVDPASLGPVPALEPVPADDLPPAAPHTADAAPPSETPPPAAESAPAGPATAGEPAAP